MQRKKVSSLVHDIILGSKMIDKKYEEDENFQLSCSVSQEMGQMTIDFSKEEPA